MRRTVCIHSLLLAATAWFNAQARTYAEAFTDEARGVYVEDINVWAYTEAFAKRFAMPEKWITPGLTGAQAVAFRVERFDGAMRFSNKGNAGMTNSRCILEVFFASDAPVDWRSDDHARIRPMTPQAPAYLVPQTPEDLKARRRTETFVGGRLTDLALRTTGGYTSTMSWLGFDREVYPGISYISLQGSCTTPPREDAFLQIPRKLESGDGSVDHLKVALPKSFMLRLYDSWRERHRAPGELRWGDLIRRE